MNVSDYSPGFAAFNIACLSYWLLALILAGVMVPPAVAQQAPSEVVLPQLTRMKLAVELDYDAERIAGTATLTLRNASDASLSRVPLLLNRLMRVDAVRTDDHGDPGRLGFAGEPRRRHHPGGRRLP
jgi:hypothetical protein